MTQATIHQTICVTGWTATVRPPTSVTDLIKTERMRAYGVGDQSKALYELDHFVPLEMGGGAADIENLWPELRSGPEGALVKDRVENAGKAAICSGRLTLDAAQQQMISDWIAFGRSLGAI